jgi:hypothetical protein
MRLWLIADHGAGGANLARTSVVDNTASLFGPHPSIAIATAGWENAGWLTPLISAIASQPPRIKDRTLIFALIVVPVRRIVASRISRQRT